MTPLNVCWATTSISAVPPFPRLRWFPEGCDFHQWTGDDSKALMKVRTSSSSQSIVLCIYDDDIRCIYQPLCAMCLVIWFDVSQHSWTSATLLGMIPYVPTLWIWSPMHWTAFTNTTKFSSRWASELMPYPCRSNIHYFTTFGRSSCSALRIVYAHQSQSRSISRLLRSRGVDPVDTTLFNRCLSLTYAKTSSRLYSLCFHRKEWCRVQLLNEITARTN